MISAAGRAPDEVEARARRRDRIEAAGPPSLLGEAEPPPPIASLARAMARSTSTLVTALEADFTQPATDPLTGSGIGSRTYWDRARVVSDAAGALEQLEPGDVLVAPFTGPAHNSILPVLGALVVGAGGPMCHAAIAAREFGLPAVIGAAGATAELPDGATVEVDPGAGTVRVVD